MDVKLFFLWQNKLKQKSNNLEFKTKDRNFTKNTTTNHGNGDKLLHDFSWKAWKRQQPPTKSLKASVWTLNKDTLKEKSTQDRRAGEGMRLLGWPGLGATTDSWVSHRRDSQHLLFFWFSRTQGWQRLGKKSLCSDNFQSWARGNCLREITRDQTSSQIVLFHSLFLLPFSQTRQPVIFGFK